MRVNSVCIITQDVKRLETFYREVLKREASLSTEQYVEFDIEGRIISFYDLAAYNDLADEPVILTKESHTFIEIEVEDVHQEYEHLKSMNVKFGKKITTQPWGITSTYFYDPDGNLINFFSRE
ncbi:MAG: VOC family protein [Lachnospiraceae bacterium]|nr:VOC family protein [Lachnospiraceae bacterium]